MENPHEAEQAVLLERIIKNVVSRASGNGSPGWAALTPPGQVQRGRSGDEYLHPGEYTLNWTCFPLGVV